MKSALAIRNQQRRRALDVPLLRRIVCWALEEHLGVARYDIAVLLVDASRMAEANEQFLQHKGSTDVITFNYGEEYDSPARNAASAFLHGELLVCVDEAIVQARDFNADWRTEIVRYAVHGILHLLGYDDTRARSRRVMKREEDRAVAAIERSFPLPRLAKPAKGKRCLNAPME